MATADQIRNLVKAFASHDDEKVKTIVLQIAAHEAKLGHCSFAQELKKEASNIGKARNGQILRINNQNAMLQISMPSVELSELISSDEVISKINRILVEFRNKNRLLGLSENAICILYDENARLKSQRAQKKAQKILERQPLQADDKSIHQRYEQYELLNCEAKEIKRRENVRAKFLSALIEDKHFQQLCEAFCAGYNLMWWKDTMQRPEELERINNQLPDELRPEPISNPDAIIHQTEVEAKALYYDCTRYFMEFLSNATSKTEVTTKKQKARK